MQSITNISKLLLCAVAITCSVFFLWHNTPWLTSSNSLETNMDDIIDLAANEPTLTATATATPISTAPPAVTHKPVITHKSVITEKFIQTHKTSNPAAQKQIAKTITTTTITKNAPSIWVDISKKFQIDRRADSSQVHAEIRKILANKKKFIQILQASTPYIHYIYAQTQAKNLPAEIALVPIVESEFNPNDHSNKGAAGLWQLMPQTARELGIKIHSGYDGRRNTVDSTRAALAYFRDLGKLFKGNWYLALAAYNCGQVKVQSVMRRTHSNNYWNLPLPRETKLYVPKLLAVAEIIKHPELYGIHLPSIGNKPFFMSVATKKPTTLSKYAEQSGIDLALLKRLNPDLKTANISVKNSLLIPTNVQTV